MQKRIKYLIVIVLVLLSGGFLVLKLSGSGDLYMTPAEFKAERNSSSNEVLKIGGLVMNSSVSAPEGGGATEIKFELKDAKESLSVIYQGIIPNTFRDGAIVIAEGTLNDKEIFRASRILVKCPENYLPERALSSALKGTKLEKWLYR